MGMIVREFEVPCDPQNPDKTVQIDIPGQYVTILEAPQNLNIKILKNYTEIGELQDVGAGVGVGPIPFDGLRIGSKF